MGINMGKKGLGDHEHWTTASTVSSVPENCIPRMTTKHIHKWLTAPTEERILVYCKCGMDIMIDQNKTIISDFSTGEKLGVINYDTTTQQHDKSLGEKLGVIKYVTTD